MQTPKKVKIAGVPVTVVSDEEAEKSDYVICMPWGTPSPFEDNLKGICSHCGIDVQYRWHAPRKPKRLCFKCWVKLDSQTSQDEL